MVKHSSRPGVRKSSYECRFSNRRQGGMNSQIFKPGRFLLECVDLGKAYSLSSRNRKVRNMARPKIKQVRVGASVPPWVNDRLDDLAQQGFMTKSYLVQMILIHGLEWAERIIERRREEQQPLKAGD